MKRIPGETMRLLRVALLGAMLAAVVFLVGGGVVGASTTGEGELDRTIGYLQAIQNSDGGFGGSPGAESEPSFSAWVAIALAAGGINPLDQAPEPGGPDLYTYLTARAEALEDTTDFERAMLVTIAAGTSPRDFGGRDLVSAILGRQLPDGSFAHVQGGQTGGVNDTAFAVICLAMIEGAATEAAVQRAADWLGSVQLESGAWGIFPGVVASASSDATAAVIQALHAAGRTGTAHETDGWRYVRTTQNVDGGFGERPGSPESNVASTSWVVQAMWSAGLEPDDYTYAGSGEDGEGQADGGDGASPLEFLASMQNSDGSIRWKPERDLNPVWMTAYAAPAFAGHSIPVPAVPRENPEVEQDPDSGPVEAGSGGRGAPLFSRPKPQSQGRATGGVRRTDRTDKATDTERRTERNRRPEPNGPTSQASGDGTGRAITGTPGPSRTNPAQSRRPSGGERAISRGDRASLPEPEPRPRPDSRPGGEAISGSVVSPAAAITGNDIESGRDGDGEREAAAPGLSGGHEAPENGLEVAILITLAMGAATLAGGLKGT